MQCSCWPLASTKFALAPQALKQAYSIILLVDGGNRRTIFYNRALLSKHPPCRVIIEHKSFIEREWRRQCSTASEWGRIGDATHVY